MLAAQVITAGLAMAGLGLGLATVLVIAHKRLFVFEDPRIDVVEDMLPLANCGACTKPGCRAFAEALVEGELSPGRCTVSPADKIDEIANYLGVDAGGEEKRVARLACAGGDHVAYQRARYDGMSTCRAADLVSGGGKGCAWGCLGLDDCAVACTFDAITMDKHGLPVVDAEKCTACGDCVDSCPRDLFSIHPVSHRLWVACKSVAEGDEAEAECAVACTACGRCEMDSPDGLVKITNNLAQVNYGKNRLASQDIIQRCPTGAIVWLDDKKGAVKGPDAKKITRKTALPVG